MLRADTVQGWSDAELEVERRLRVQTLYESRPHSHLANISHAELEVIKLELSVGEEGNLAVGEKKAGARAVEISRNSSEENPYKLIGFSGGGCFFCEDFRLKNL